MNRKSFLHLGLGLAGFLVGFNLPITPKEDSEEEITTPEEPKQIEVVSGTPYFRPLHFTDVSFTNSPTCEECVIYEKQLSSEEVQKVYKYLKSKHQISNSYFFS